MSYYVGCGGKIIVREEFRDLVQNRLDLTGTTDPVFMLCNDLGTDNLFYRTVQWEKWNFDRERGFWDFRVVYNMRHYGDPIDTLLSYILPYISREIIEIYEYDEEHARDWPVDSSWRNTLQDQIEHRDRTIREICDELQKYRR